MKHVAVTATLTSLSPIRFNFSDVCIHHLHVVQNKHAPGPPNSSSRCKLAASHIARLFSSSVNIRSSPLLHQQDNGKPMDILPMVECRVRVSEAHVAAPLCLTRPHFRPKQPLLARLWWDASWQMIWRDCRPRIQRVGTSISIMHESIGGYKQPLNVTQRHIDPFVLLSTSTVHRI